MNISNQEHQQDLHHIKQMMERSSRFISLSGLSGIAAGSCALVGAYFAYDVITDSRGIVLKSLDININETSRTGNISIESFKGNRLFVIVIKNFIKEFILSFMFKNFIFFFANYLDTTHMIILFIREKGQLCIRESLKRRQKKKKTVTKMTKYSHKHRRLQILVSSYVRIDQL